MQCSNFCEYKLWQESGLFFFNSEYKCNFCSEFSVTSKLFYEGIKSRMYRVDHVSIPTLANKHKTELP